MPLQGRDDSSASGSLLASNIRGQPSGGESERPADAARPVGDTRDPELAALKRPVEPTHRHPTPSRAGPWPGAPSGLTLPNRDSSSDPATRAARVGCVQGPSRPMDEVRRNAVSVNGARERCLSAGPAERPAPNRSQPASKDRFKALRALCSTPALPCSGCAGQGKGRLMNLSPVDTYDHHRMAMCCAQAAACGVPLHIKDPQCVSKTFLDFFTRLAGLVPAAPSRPGRHATDSVPPT
jgi:hypothetical protein